MTTDAVPAGVKPGSKNQIRLKAKMHPGVLVRKEIIDEKARLGLFTVKPADGSPIPGFVAGQYTSLGLEVAQDFFITRAYSIASPPSQKDSFEFYIALVVDGALTPHMFKSEEGATWYFYKPVGHFTLDKTQRKRFFFVSTGTGLAPFRSMVCELENQGRLGEHHVVMANGASYEPELGYRAEMEGFAQRYSDRFMFIPSVSRPAEKHPADLSRGRINDLLRTMMGYPHETAPGKEPHVGVGLDPKKIAEICPPKETAVFLCGNPSMIEDMREPLEKAGYDEVHVEEYW